MMRVSQLNLNYIHWNWLILLLLTVPWPTKSASLFPAMKNLADYSPINSSSTCGSPEIKVCRSSIQSSSIDVCTEDTCKFACCPTCSSSKPVPTDLGNIKPSTVIGIRDGPSRPGSSKTSFMFESGSDSHIDPLNLGPAIDYTKSGFTVSVWVKQKDKNKGTLISKTLTNSQYTVIFQVEIDNYQIWFYYQYEPNGNTSLVQLKPLQSQMQNLKPDEWHLITVTVVSRYVSYFIDGKLITAATLKGAVKDPSGRVRIGQRYGGSSQFEGFMQDVFLYNIALTNREVIEAYTGILPKEYVATSCRCPPDYPKVMETHRAKCTRNVFISDDPSSKSTLRLADTAHPIELATDGDTNTFWQSELTDKAVVYLDLKYGELQVLYIILQFYGPQPSAIKIERSRDNGRTFFPWQYFAADCTKSFNMANNGALSQPDSVNCIQFELPLSSSGAEISFKTEQPPPPGSAVPVRPFGSPCTNLYCSPKLLEFIKASYARFSFYNHTLVKNAKHRYFALNRIVVAGRCECFGHAKSATYIASNATQSGKCVCQCEAATYSEGEKCDRCKPLYNKKPFKRGTNTDSSPCIKCECNQHAASCYYNKTLDPNPSSRTLGGGGVCINCQHNTTGRYCDICKETFYRESGKSKSAIDVCTHCACTGPGVLPNKFDCVKDDTTQGKLAGQCECKQYTEGRQCNQCKPGYFDLKANHATGCVTCGCNTAGTINGNTTCHTISGQCHCKSNVMGVKCDTCKPGYYGLNTLEASGCSACSCDPFGSLNKTVCNIINGQCQCKPGSKGLRCDQCDEGYHSLDANGCKTCNCSKAGSKPLLVNKCEAKNGQCYCKTNTEGLQCDRCRSGYFNLAESNPDGCTVCTCDPKGTVGKSTQCEVQSGNCTCKRYVIGKNCNQCQIGTYNLNQSNPDGCQLCNCFAKGTKDPASGSVYSCSSNLGECNCLSNVVGRQCNSCAAMYYWNPSGKGCVACNCDSRGSRSTSCNMTSGQCECKANIGGLRCDRCLPGNYGFNTGNCQPCGCNVAGSSSNVCDDTGKCTCKQNVEGNKCDTCKTGTVNLQANNSFGCSGVPSQQPPPRATIISSRILNVKWNNPDNPNGVIDRFELYRNGTMVYRGLQRDFNDTGLTPNTYYYYYVITYTERGNTRSYQDNKVYKTPEDSPQEINPPKLTEVKARTAKASWVRPNVTNGVITQYRLVSVDSRSSSEVEHCRGLIFSCDLSGLKPFTTYNFTLVACNSGGCGRSLPMKAITSEAAPDFQPMPNVTLVPGGKELIVYWDEPPIPNGKVFRYDLYMRSSPFSGPGSGISPTSPVDVRNITVPNFVPYTLYEFRVVSYTAQINGAKSSDWRRVRTAEGVPSGEAAMQPKATAVSSTAIRVAWSPPSLPRGIIVKFTVKVAQPARYVDANGNQSSLVVTGLSPYTRYKFTVVACNSYRCTGESGETDETRTIASAPIGQNPPTVTNVNANSVSLNWSHPQTPNGPVPPSFNVSRAPSAFNDPPQEVTAGAHFPGLGYYKFSDNVIIQGDRNDIEFSFRTQTPNGLVLLMASDDLQDVLAVEIRDGKPWFVFDCQSGPAAFTVATGNRFDDSQWHYVKLTRNGISGSINVDGKYSGSGTAGAGSNVIGGYKAVYIGGLPKSFKYDRTGKAKLNKYNFIGCLKNFKSENKVFQWDKALEKTSVTPFSNGCPVRGDSPGAILHGGGFLAISSNLFKGGTMFPFEMSFRTQVKSGLLVFGSGPSAYVGLGLNNGKLTLKLQGADNSTSYTIQSGDLCDGNWQKIEIFYLGAIGFNIFVNGKNHAVGDMGDIVLNTNLFIGGIPSNNAQIIRRVKDAGIDSEETFIGCVKGLKTIQKLDLSRDIVERVNSDLDGCVSNNTIYTSLKRGTCLGMDSKTLVTQTVLRYTDSSVNPFVDYLYRVSSFHPNVPGSAKSSWVFVRSGPGAPGGIDAPTSVTPLQDGRSAQVMWKRPSKPNGLIVYYHIIATDSMKNKVVKQVNDVDVFSSTINGLKPYTFYEIAIGAFTAGGNGTGPSANITTLQAAPEGVPIPSAKRYPRMLALYWPEPSSPNGIITHYNLTVDKVLKYSGVNRAFNMSGLEVYKPYSVQLTACTHVGCTKGSEATIYTGELPPEGLTQPTLFVRGNDSMRVGWNQPTKPNGIITHYEIHISTSEPLGSSYKVVYNGSRSDLSATITRLVTGTLYYVRFKAYSGGGGTFSPASSARTMSGIPSDIPAPILTAISPYSIHVQILPPKKPNGVITRYELYQDNITLPVLNESKLANYTAQNLEVYSRHTFRVKACTFKGCNPSELAVGYSGELPPKGTITLQATITNARHVKVTWTRLAEHNGNVTYYLIIKGRFLITGSAVMATEIRNERAVGEPGKEWTYRGLLPNSSYQFWVNASNTKGYIVSNTVNGKTPEAAPDGILPPKANVLSSSSINVTWQPPYLSNGVLLGYTLYQKTNNIDSVLYNGTSLSYVVTGLEPYTGYHYRISAYTAADTGFGNWTSVVTHEDVPGTLDPPRLSPESKSMVLEWNPPSKPNGVIIQYSIYMNDSFLTNVTGNVTKHTASNLQPFTPYTFAIAACTVVGCTQSNYSRPARTLESVPSGLNKPVLKALAPRSVQISWDMPNVTNGIIISYSIYRRKTGQQTPSKIATVNASIPQVYIDRTVQPFTSYEYRVVAYTTAGGGTPSDYSNVMTGEGDPEGIAAPDVTASSSSSLLVKWKAPTIPNGYVINYIVRVLETGGNFSMNSSNVFQYSVTGLKPYIEYSIVIRACTIGDCGEGPPTKKRTLTATPSGQPAPTAEVLSSTSLRLRWAPPTDPNSPIERYELFRKTIEEPVNGNFTMPATFTKVYSNNGRMYVDSDLGIYSLQRYKVVVFTSTGNSTSQTADHRTGPAPPLAGPIVNATALNHTTVMLSWKPPNIKLLRGSVEKYVIYHEQIISSVNTVVHQYATVPGTQTSLAVTGLKPSTNYKFWVILYNKAGNHSSTTVAERTLDGVPEGFKAPQLWEKSSTEIRVNWQPPDTPNGQIVIYKIYANGKNHANATASEREKVLTGLVPYTLYSIQVEVCTVYACTKSPTASKRTLPAAPERLAAPRLTPGPNYITVDWDPPARPNGVMSGYIIYRRKIDACPTSPPPVVKCTYIECNISQELCGNTCFNPIDKICCNGVLHVRDRNDPKKQCCGKAYVTKNNADDVCCGNKFHLKQNNYECCYNNYMRVPSGSVCCQRSDGGALVGFGDSCCGDRPYFLNGSKVCVCDGLFDKSPPRQCCGGKVVASAQICCGDKQSGQAYDIDASKICCGTSYVTEKTSLCCKGSLNNYKIYNYSSNAEKVNKSEKCCNTNKVSSGMSCCNTQPYNSTSQTCADKTSKGDVNCGTGVVCGKSSSNSAVCNRCDFPFASRICGYVEGYYAPTSVPSTPKTCASEYQEVYKNLNTPSVLSFKDTNLSPHTEYDYYLVGVNPQGNTSSPVARNKTLMASPEGLDPPVATAISASAIRVTWKQPRVLNGILKEYKLTRINQQTKKRTLVYTGWELTYTDSSGLEPFTGYLYELQACTTECAAVVSTVVAYTDEAAPTVVSPPNLIPISSTSINVTWSLPPKPNGRIIRYNISQIINSTYKIRLQPNNAGLSMFLIVSNLTPYSNYTFQVAACNKIGCKEGPSAWVLTLEAPPQGVKNPTLIATGAREVEASWYKPDIPNGVIIKYSLFRNGTLVYNGTDVCSKTSLGLTKCIYKDTGLKPITWYSYSISAATKGGTSRSGNSTIQTPESSPEGVPLPRLTPRTATEIYAEWDAPQTPNGVITRYALIVDDKEHDAGLNKNKLIGSLKPFTRYAFRVKACTSKGCGVGDRAYATTLEAPATGIKSPTLEAKEWNVVYITWEKPSTPNGIITEYRVERRLGNQAPIIVCLTKGPTLSIRNCLDSQNNMKGYTVYDYRILAVNKGGVGNGNWNNVRTLEGPPRGIKQPLVHVINATAVQAKWEAPLEPNGVIIYYELRYQPLNVVGGNISVAGRVDSSTFNITVNVLKPNTDYQFLITAINKRREGSSSWTTAKTLEAPPSDIKLLKAERLSGGTSLRLYWDAPGSPNGIITRYNIYKDGIKIFEDKTREYVVTKLIPYTSYEFQLEACTSAGCTKGTKQTIFSAEVIPSGQAAPTAGFINDTVVKLNWRQPAVPNGVIVRYDVIRSAASLQARRRRSVNEKIIYSTNNTNASLFTYTDSNLDPYTRYKYKIRAVNNGGQVDSDWLTVDTRQAAPSSVKPPTVTALDANRMNISWTPPQRPNGIMQYYLVHRNGTIIHQGSKLSYTDVGLQPFTVYGYTITACSGGGCTVSQPAAQRTKEAAPEQVRPPVLSALSAIAIRITWNSPSKPNGMITTYRLYESANPTPIYSGSDVSFTISARKPYTVYSFYIEACTAAGCTKGPAASVRTLQSPPGQMSAPVATVAGAKHVRVQWSPPNEPNGVIKYYILTRDGKVVYNGTDLRYDDYDIAPYTVYSYTITAYNTAGKGMESPVGRNPKTYPGAPSNITAPTLTVLSSTSIHVKWTEPGIPNGIISKYSVLYNGLEKDAGLAREITLMSLQPYTLYTVRMKVCTTSVACSIGEIAQARTLEAAPESQGRPVFPSESLKARSVLITWSEPARPNGFIIKYTLQRRRVNRPSGSQITYGAVTSIYNASNGTALAFTDRTVEPYSEYEYRVASANSVGATTSGWAVVKTLTDIPENMPKPEITQTFADRIQILIRAPSKPNGEVRRYVVKISGRNTTSGLELSRVLSGLQPYTNYDISVYACTDAGCVESPKSTARTTEAAPTSFSAPRIVKVLSRSVELAWDPPAKPNGVIKRYEVFHRVSCAVPSSCELPANSTTAGSQTKATIEGLSPYITYDFIVRAHNDKFYGDSDIKAARTLPEDPVTRPDSPPRVNVTGYHVSVDWSKCFILNGPLDGYTLLEKGIIAFLGEKTSAYLPNRERGEYTYEVLVTTIVNGAKKTARSIKVTVAVPYQGVIQPEVTAQPRTAPVYETIWFIAVMALVGILLLFVILALCLRKRSGDRTVYVREREPLPPRTKMRSRPSSMSSLYSAGDRRSIMDMNTFNNGSTVALYDNGGRLTPKAEHYDSIDRYERYHRYNKHMDLSNGSVHKLGFDESSDWNDPPRTFSTKDSGLYLDEKPPFSDSDDDSLPHHYGYRKEQYFTDTHL